MSLREENKEARRQRILRAAARLLERGGADELTMRRLARDAEVSEMTPYNLFGSKGGVIAALFEAEMSRIVDASFREMPTDPLERMFASTEILASTWTDPAGLFRELVRSAAESRTHLTAFSNVPIAMLEAGLTELGEAGLIRPEVPLADLARHVSLANQGAYESWATGQTDGATLRSDLLHGLAIGLLSVATPATRKRILAHLAARPATTGRVRKSRQARRKPA